ncbi:hypothetical protein DAPPUDRAFT_262570 [Daphnia pulex]|uniref:Uncharacterized protein n=1 Tax=Daphnia pulex TaxID=6669 RepID=E9HN82_DAPPU|nr:hypothetical protein DAPPUDRAFT_262570 [Daphnia pulex]|eukprot:EFX66802.1 hypothetical protein DAPPUDRAFT_262570 [Daphnia pulex]
MMITIRTSDGSEVSQSHTPNISERSGEQDCTVSSPNQSASISCFGSKERTGAEEGSPIGQSADLGTTDSVVAGSSGLGNESNPDRLNGVDGIDARSGGAQREEESPEEIIRACSDSSEDRLTVATLSGDLARAGKTSSDAQSLHEFLGFVPKEGKEFLDFSPRRELQELDEEGDYHNLSSKLPKHISRKYSNDRDLLNGDQQDNSSSASPFRDSQIKQQIKPSSSSEEPKSSSGTVREYSLEGGKGDLTKSSRVNSTGGRELPAERQENQAKSGSTEKNPNTIDRIQTKSNVRSTGATARNLRIDPDIIEMANDR